MHESETRLEETVTLSQASELIQCLAAHESLLLLSPPGVGKSETIKAAAESAGMSCRSLLGTQIAPEDVSGVPQIVGERSVFCPPRVLLPETNEPFCLFLDELPACAPDIQKAFYALLLERRIGEHALPAGSWVVAAGNRAQDRAMVRTLSSALVNRVIVLNVRVDSAEWISWAKAHEIDSGIVEYIRAFPDALLDTAPRDSVPFSTPRAWALLSEALKLGIDPVEYETLPLPSKAALCRSLAAGRISGDDVRRFVNFRLIHQALPELLQDCDYFGVLSRGVAELPLSPAVTQSLIDASIATVIDLVNTDRANLIRIVGHSQIAQVEADLADWGLWLGMAGQG